MKEIEGNDPKVRVLKNLEEGDGILVLKTPGESPGTNFVMRAAYGKNMAFFISDPFYIANVKAVVDWVWKHSLQKITVVGPRESKSPGICQKSKMFVKSVITQTIIRGIIADRKTH